MFDIRLIDNGFGFEAIVTAIGYESPLSALSGIEGELRVLDNSLTGTVVFDLVCSNGLEWNRFMVMNIKDGSFVFSTLHVVEQSQIPSWLLEHQAVIFKNNPQFFEDSIITHDEYVHIVAA